MSTANQQIYASLHPETRPDVLIIGSGIIGSASAYYLARKGYRVTVLEKEEIIGNGASSRNGGCVRATVRDPRELQLASYGIRHIWPWLSEELGTDVEYVQRGALFLAKSEEDMANLRRLTKEGQECGLDCRLIDGDEVRRINANLAPELLGAIWNPTDGYANPYRATLAFYLAARRLGVHYIAGQEVIKLQKVRGRIGRVITADRAYEADYVIAACGYAARTLLADVGIDIPMQKHIDEALVTEPMPRLFHEMLGTIDGSFYGHQEEAGTIAIGASMGLEAFSKDTGYPYSTSLSAPCIARGIRQCVPRMRGAKIVRHWAGWIDVSADGVPVIDSVEEVPGLVIACGFSGHGFGISPAVGTVISEIIEGKPTSVDISALHYDRFKAKGSFNV